MIIPIRREGAFEAPQAHSSNHSTTKKSVTIITPKITESHFEPKEDKRPIWEDFSALKAFDMNNKRWARDDIENFLVPTISSKSLLKEKFDTFKNNFMTPTNMFNFKEHPIKIETFVTESDRYVLTLNVQQFKPEELQVKVTDDTISISGKHEEKQDEMNFSSSEYSRKHSLPPGVKADDVKCNFSSDGVLTVTAPRKVQPALMRQERSIPIQHTGLPAIRV